MSIGAGHDPVEPGPEEPERSGKKWTLAVSCLIAVFTLLGVYAVVSGVTRSSSGTSASSTKPASGSASASASHAGSASAAASPSSPLSPPSSPQQHELSITSATAFGPEGTSDGDNPGIASRVIGNGSAQPWYSSWYTTPEFGELQAGTGLLLDMGRAVTISGVQLVLGSPLGTSVQVRVGDAAVLSDLSTVATATDVGGIVQLPTASRASRYVLIWFTALPPNGQGKYQVNVYSATVDGTAGA